MRIKAKCRKHPAAFVLFLEGTVAFQNKFGQFVQEETERGTTLSIDEGNLYCEANDPFSHELYFEILTMEGR